MSVAFYLVGLLPALKRPLIASAQGLTRSRACAPGGGANLRSAVRANFRGFSSLPSHVVLTMPALSPTMDQGNIAKWYITVGQEVSAGTVLADIETDKATMAFENQEDGFVATILLPDGSKDIPIGTPVAVLAENKEDIAAFANYSNAPAAAAAASSSSPAAPSSSSVAPQPKAPSAPANHRISPAVRILLAEAGLSAHDVTGTGPKSIITKADVLTAIVAGVKPSSSAPPPAAPPPAAAAAAAAAPQAAAVAAKPAASTPASTVPAKPAAPAPAVAPVSKSGSYVDTPNSQIRKIIAKRLLESKVTIPGLYVSVDAKLDALTALRTSLQGKGMKVSVNDFVLKAVAAALVEVPDANVFWDDKDEVVKPFSSVDICVAVATERGLMTPIVKDAAGKSLQAISKDVKSLALKARENKLKPDEFTGGSFTVSNLGMLGVSSFFAIINPPQAGIIAVGGTQQKVVLGADGQPRTESFMTLSLSADHRVYDGALAAAFLKALKANLESPVNLLTC